MTVTRSQIFAALKEVVDPEIGLNVVDLGFIYEVKITPKLVEVTYTLTNEACPLGSMLGEQIDQALQSVIQPPQQLKLKLVFDPPWTPDLMSAAAKLQLGW